MREKILGCLFGGAIGDAMGLPCEGATHPCISNPEQWSLSDDTQLTIATCEAIVEAGGVYPSVIASRFLAWYQENRITHMGAGTLKALRDLASGRHWSVAGRKGEMAAGNGAAMRIAPLAFFLAPASYDDRVVIREVARITHHHEEAYVGALAIIIAIRTVLSPNGDGSEMLAAYVADSLPDSQIRDRLQQFSQLDRLTPLPVVAERFGASGYVVESVPFAIFAAQTVTRHGFEEVIREVVAAGGDTDTNASMAGHIAGAYLGNDKLPRHLRDKIPYREHITAVAHQLAALCDQYR